MEILEVESTRGIKPALIALLQDCVASGASVGFLPPLQEEQGLAYWQGIEGELADGVRKLWVAFDQHHLVGALQLSLCTKANGGHRAEVEKLMVHSQARGKGVGRALMNAMEQGPGTPGVPCWCWIPGSATWPPASIASSAIRRPARSRTSPAMGTAPSPPPSSSTSSSEADGLARPDSVPVLPPPRLGVHRFLVQSDSSARSHHDIGSRPSADHSRQGH